MLIGIQGASMEVGRSQMSSQLVENLLRMCPLCSREAEIGVPLEKGRHVGKILELFLGITIPSKSTLEGRS